MSLSLLLINVTHSLLTDDDAAATAAARALGEMDNALLSPCPVP